MVHHVVIVAECPQLWKNLHKIRILSGTDDNCATKQSNPQISSQYIFYEIVSYLNKFDAKKSYRPSSVYVEIYDSSSCKFVPLLRSRSKDQSIISNSNSRCASNSSHPPCSLNGTRFRCIIHIGKESSCYNSSHDGNSRQEGPLLLIKGRFFDYNPHGMDFAGKTLIVKEESNNKDENGTGLNVWDGSLLLARYLEQHPSKVRGKSILELGSGPGLVGIAAAILGSREVILSDLSYALPLMKRNVEFNKSTIESAQCEKIDCIEINWFLPPDIDSLSRCKKFPEVILIADCVWLEELVTPLMDTLEKYCISNHQIEVIITYQRRGKAADVLFWERVRLMFTSITTVDTLNDCGIHKPDFLTLLICKR